MSGDAAGEGLVFVEQADRGPMEFLQNIASKSGNVN